MRSDTVALIMIRSTFQAKITSDIFLSSFTSSPQYQSFTNFSRETVIHAKWLHMFKANQPTAVSPIYPH